jgi:Amt family ammonium transporter
MNKRWLLPFFILALLACVGVFMPTTTYQIDNSKIDTGDTAWMLTATGLVLLMTPGLSFFYAGMVRFKNLISTMLQSFVALGVVSLLWVVVGFSLAFGDSLGGLKTGIIGNPTTYFMFNHVSGLPIADFAPTIPFALFALFQLKFAVITPALITGGFAERIRFSAFLLFICLFIICIYTPLAHATWHPNGLLRNWGVLDFAGGTVVHISAGFAALAGAMFLGKRKHQADEPSNIPYVMLGTGMLWFGWFGFNGGSALGANETATLAFLNTNTASAAAMLTWIFFDGVTGKRPSAMGACVGAVVGLVAITPAAAFVHVGQSIFIGFSASIISNLAVRYKHKISLDDTLDVGCSEFTLFFPQLLC